MQEDVIIIGAGAAGLMAANVLSAKDKKVIVLEGRDRIGGRILTVENSFLQLVECGAEFIHGKLPLTLQLLKEAGIHYVKSEGSIWHKYNNKLEQQEDFIEDYDLLIKELKKLDADTSVGAFLDQHFADEKYSELRKSITGYVNGYYAADLYKASALALKEELQKQDEEQYHIEGGYTKLVNYLYQKCIDQQCTFQLSAIAKNIEWQKGFVNITTDNGKTFTASQLIVAIPLGVLTSADTRTSISFAPNIPAVETASMLGFGSTIKILLHFKNPFWQQQYAMDDMAFLFSDEEVPTWWTQHPIQSNLLTGWCAGPNADKLKHLTEQEIFEKALTSLANIFSTTSEKIKDELTAWQVCNWATDPFTHGGYTYITVHTERVLKMLNQPVEETIHFAGEALHNGPEVGTVEAALQSGKNVAERVLKML